MINISKSGNAIKFAFTDSDHYLYGNGEIEVPVNSLSLIVDESNMVTFRKANSNDIFLSFDPANSNLSDKAGVINFYKTNMVGSTGGGGGTGSGVTSGEVQTMIDESLDDYYDKDEVDTAFETVNASLSGKADTSYVNAALGDKADTSAVTAVANDVSTLSGQVETKVATTDFSAYSAATDARIAEDEEVTAAALNDLNDRIGSGGGALFVDFDDLMNNMNDDKWDELVNAIQNNKPIFEFYDYSDEYVTDVGQKPIDGYVFITEDNESAEIGLKQLYGGGWYGVTIIKNGSEDYDVSDYGEDYQPMGDYQTLLIAGSGISIDESNVISVTGGSSVTVDSAITSASTNAVENRAIYNKVTMEVGDPTIIEYDDEPVTSTTSGSRYYKVEFNDELEYVTFTVEGLPDTIKLNGDTGQITYTSGGALPEGLVTDTRYQPEYGVGHEIAFSSDYNVISAVVGGQGGDIYVGHTGTSTEWVKDVVADLLETVSDKADTSAVTAAIDAATSGKVDTSAITSAMTSSSTDAQVPSAKAVYDTLGGLKFVKLTQSDYDQLATKDNDTLYIISNVVS